MLNNVNRKTKSLANKKKYFAKRKCHYCINKKKKNIFYKKNVLYECTSSFGFNNKEKASLSKFFILRKRSENGKYEKKQSLNHFKELSRINIDLNANQNKKNFILIQSMKNLKGTSIEKNIPQRARMRSKRIITKNGNANSWEIVHQNFQKKILTKNKHYLKNINKIKLLIRSCSCRKEKKYLSEDTYYYISPKVSKFARNNENLVHFTPRRQSNLPGNMLSSKKVNFDEVQTSQKALKCNNQIRGGLSNELTNVSSEDSLLKTLNDEKQKKSKIK